MRYVAWIVALSVVAFLGVACASDESGDDGAARSGGATTGATASADRAPVSTPKPSVDAFSVRSFEDNGRRYSIRKVLSKDAIPAIFSPDFLTPEDSHAELQYRPETQVIGVSIGGEHRAYHVAHLSGREIVNDVVGGEPIAVTW